MGKTAYVTDLKGLQGECSANYLRLTRLLGELTAGETRELELFGKQGGFGTLSLTVLEQAPYTTMVQVSQGGLMDEVVEPLQVRVHLYHDVRMAEVTDFQRQRHFSGRYRYPNVRMFQPDEKLQINRFLGEWLAHGLAHGHASLPESLD